MKTMAEVVLLHSNFGRDGQGQYCTACNYRYGYGTGRELKRRASDHIAAALTAAGYGPVKEAAARALNDAADDSALRLAGHSGISISRLRARAAALEAD